MFMFVKTRRPVKLAKDINVKLFHERILNYIGSLLASSRHCAVLYRSAWH